MHFRTAIKQLELRLGEQKAGCTADDRTHPSGYRVTVESEGDELHRAACHRHVFDAANELSADLGMVVRLHTTEPAGDTDE